jgi:putative N6-adenine-specific DNA methylase
MQKIFLVVPPGLEAIARQETNDYLSSLPGKKNILPGNEELEYECDLAGLLQANQNFRIPNRILVRLASFKATNFPELVKKASRIQWENFIGENAKIAIRTTCKKSKLYHSDAVSQRIHASIEKRLVRKIQMLKSGLEEDSGLDIQILVVRIVDDLVEISIDSSGAPLYKRGYRQAVTKAPLRENLATALILAAGWDPQTPLIDPFCGSGTIPIEAALLQKQMAPGMNRHFIMEKWPIYLKESRYFKIAETEPAGLAVGRKNIFGSDRDAGAIQIADDNSQRANMGNSITWHQHAFSDMPDIPEPGWIITNPPYGQRISAGHDLRNLYAQFGNILRKRFVGWKTLYLCSDPNLASQTQLDAKVVLSFSNGGINVKAYYAEID